MTKEEAARRVRALRAHCDAEYAAIAEALGNGINVDGIDVEREADAIATIGAAIREAIDPRWKGRIRRDVRRALGYTSA